MVDLAHLRCAVKACTPWTMARSNLLLLLTLKLPDHIYLRFSCATSFSAVFYLYYCIIPPYQRRYLSRISSDFFSRLYAASSLPIYLLRSTNQRLLPFSLRIYLLITHSAIISSHFTPHPPPHASNISTSSQAIQPIPIQASTNSEPMHAFTRISYIYLSNTHSPNPVLPTTHHFYFIRWTKRRPYLLISFIYSSVHIFIPSIYSTIHVY